MEKIFYSPKGFWKRHSAVSKLEKKQKSEISIRVFEEASSVANKN